VWCIVHNCIHVRCFYFHGTGQSKSLSAPDNYSTKNMQKYSILNSFNHLLWTVLYWTWSLRTQFGMSINVWRLVGDTLNITCYFLYCNHQVHRGFVITLCIQTRHSKTFYNEWSSCLAIGCWAVNFSLKKGMIFQNYARGTRRGQILRQHLTQQKAMWFVARNAGISLRTVLRKLEQY
jgi:hypothetical protein